ncbi:N-acetylglucosamine-1-phosphate uridyltransferase [Pseudomonas syringae pv. primulae]|uniref:N-acetylglucosamine-1-phosphate uridyltransferase n=1 Tax=Pseudomonas syringae pv. primulae TaxID=251707 RepID=A0A3M5TTJ3_9PSED|nr:N-acetylglucosamine-1-phosphate uridyltransferase [Pseudomonas syringae pv. primulae]RMU36653.1 Bifunctional protein GlmU [Pseudomonas syringae pv. primulae]
MHSGLVQLAYAYFDGAMTAAGSTINQNIPAEQLGVARARQRNIEGWKRPVKIRKD